MNPDSRSPAYVQAVQAFQRNDAVLFHTLLVANPDLKARIRDPIPDHFHAPLITLVQSREMLDVLIDLGADLNAKSDWWAGGFGLLHQAPHELAHYAIERGARVDIHAAARLNLLDRVRDFLRKDPGSVHSRGGDGQTPLHFARTIPMVDLLLDHGANPETRDIDHESTALEYMLDDRAEVARHLVHRGCRTDILTAAALGDEDRVRQHFSEDPECIRKRVSEEWFPMIGGKCGGTILQWNLGWYVSAHQAAHKRGHSSIFEWLMSVSPSGLQCITWAWLGNGPAMEGVFSQFNEGSVARDWKESDLRQAAHAARNNDSAAFQRMLRLGLPVSGKSQHGGTALHWAAWHGNLEMVNLALARNPDLEDRDNEFKSPPLGWAQHGSMHGWHRASGNYPAVIQALVDAGCRPAT